MIQNHQKPTLGHILDGCYSVELIKGGIAVELADGKVAYTDEELNNRHPGLFDALQYFAQTKNINITQLLKLTLTHWEGKCRPLDTQADIYETPPVHIELLVHNSKYHIYTQRYKVTRLSSSLEIVTDDYGGGYSSIQKTLLDELYPGLAQRVDLLHDIGMEPTELSRLTLADYQTLTTKIELGNITFV